MYVSGTAMTGMIFCLAAGLGVAGTACTLIDSFVRRRRRRTWLESGGAKVGHGSGGIVRPRAE